MTGEIIQGDCRKIMCSMADNSVDLVFGSPPYEDARTYGIDFNLKGQDWVDWMVTVVQESLRVCKGLVAFVVAGRTRNYKWSATPALLMADLHRAGVNLRNPAIFHRIGIPGSGCGDWLRSDYEFIVCCTPPGKLPWSDNTAMGKQPIFRSRGLTKRRPNGEREKRKAMVLEIANPGNVIHCKVGGGHMGSDFAHENEAPFPEYLAEFFVRSFCPPEGTVLDPFGGSGTAAAVAEKWGRNAISIDIRESQCEIARKRIAAEREKVALFQTAESNK